MFWPIRRLNGSRHGGALALVVAAAVIVAAPYLATGFIVDDFYHLEHLLHRDGVSRLAFAIQPGEYDLFLWPRLPDVKVIYFRPLVMLSLWADAALWGTNPVGFHATNLVLHALNAVLVFHLARRVGCRRSSAAAAALVWSLGVHTTAAVAWVTGRTELLVTAFTLSATLAFLRWRRTGRERWLLGAMALVAGACLTKESAAVTPALVLLADLAAAGGGRSEGHAARGRWRGALLLAAPAVVLVMARVAVMRAPLPPPPYFDLPHSPATMLALGGKAALYYGAAVTSLPVLPLMTFTWLGERPMLAALLVAAAVALSGCAALRARKPMLWIGWFLVALLPYLALMPFSLYLYGPSIGLALLVGLSLDAPRPRLAATWAVATCVVGIVGHLTVARLLPVVSTQLARSTTVIAGLTRRHAPRALLLVDAPLWAYALPAALRLEDPGYDTPIHVLSFAPDLAPRGGSTVSFPRAHRLRLESQGSGYYRSAVERFMLFGPASPPLPGVPTGPVTGLGIEGDWPHPTALLFDLDPAVGDTLLTLRFCGWRVVRVTATSMACPAGSLPVARAR